MIELPPGVPSLESASEADLPGLAGHYCSYLFCCAGGAAKGYDDAGFDVFGVDVIETTELIPTRLMVADATALPCRCVGPVRRGPCISAVPSLFRPCGPQWQRILNGRN